MVACKRPIDVFVYMQLLITLKNKPGSSVYTLCKKFVFTNIPFNIFENMVLHITISHICRVTVVQCWAACYSVAPAIAYL